VYAAVDRLIVDQAAAAAQRSALDRIAGALSEPAYSVAAAGQVLSALRGSDEQV
jgi:hypothetical protein